MSFLTPLYLLGALAVFGPLLFHLIRRTPRGEVVFSSLMFLAPTPPTLTRRSRLDHILLLLLRAAALALLAFAFTRPFLRRESNLDLDSGQRQRVVLLVDASASMRRGDVWARARKAAAAVLDAARPDDEIALLAFDVSSRPLVTFEESASLDPARRLAVARARLEGLTPSWGATNLGQALVDAVAAIEDVGDKSDKTARLPRRVVLVSDLQQGARLEALGNYQWPSDVDLELKTIAETGSNAGLQWLADPVDAPGPANSAAPTRRVRVVNDPASRRQSFGLAWVDDKGTPGAAPPVAVDVPPGESRVVKVLDPAPDDPRHTLRLSGDTDGFDNALYLAAEPKQVANVLYLGPDSPDDPAGLLYYLQRVFADTPKRTVRVVAASAATPLKLGKPRDNPLVVVASDTTPDNARLLKEHARAGGTVLVVLARAGRSETLAALLGVAASEIPEATVGRDVMLGEIAFDHPLFAPLAGPQFSDFTKIHFWKYRSLKAAPLGDARVVARFENGDPALVARPEGLGRVVVLATGWSPSDSQLARSSKFVPLMASLLEAPGANKDAASDYHVDDHVPLPDSPRLAVRKPDGATAAPAPGAATFDDTSEPGVYTIETPGDPPRAFAVNLDPAESKTAPFSVETLQQYGCRIATPERQAADREHRRQMRNVELEGRQKLWRWLIVAALGVLIVETWLAGRLTRTSPARVEALAT